MYAYQREKDKILSIPISGISTPSLDSERVWKHTHFSESCVRWQMKYFAKIE